MTGYNLSSLSELLESVGEERVQSILAEYSCPLNHDVEDFLRQKALVFDRQGLSKTFLVHASYQGSLVLVGYFAVANKILFIRSSSSLSSTLRRRINKFAARLDGVRGYEICAPLIAQLGKNFSCGYDKLITGDELLSLACDHVRRVQSLVGGKVAYLECEDTPRLLEFYERNGFVPFDRRPVSGSSCLVQMLRYF